MIPIVCVILSIQLLKSGGTRRKVLATRANRAPQCKQASGDRQDEGSRLDRREAYGLHPVGVAAGFLECYVLHGLHCRRDFSIDKQTENTHTVVHEHINRFA